MEFAKPRFQGHQAPIDKDSHMRFYIFKSETSRDLQAFAADEIGTGLPENHAPWRVTGVVSAEVPPPHNLSRKTIEQAIEREGFQLWRLRKKAAVAKGRKAVVAEV
jgi:hypothetical protein